jgi:hypothetical protein
MVSFLKNNGTIMSLKKIIPPYRKKKPKLIKLCTGVQQENGDYVSCTCGVKWKKYSGVPPLGH